MQEYIINACQGRAIDVKKDQLIAVIDIDGGQVVDFFAENPNKRKPVKEYPPVPQSNLQPCMSVAEAMLRSSEILPVRECEGRVLASPSVGCPPAVPIVVCGEKIDAQAVAYFKYYGIESVSVLCES